MAAPADAEYLARRRETVAKARAGQVTPVGLRSRLAALLAEYEDRLSQPLQEKVQREAYESAKKGAQAGARSSVVPWVVGGVLAVGAIAVWAKYGRPRPSTKKKRRS